MTLGKWQFALGAGLLALAATGVSAQTENTLLDFTGTNGNAPNSGLIQDAKGNLYGATMNGGTGTGNGTVYRLTPRSRGGWKETVLYSFNASPDGSDPEMPFLAMDGHGALYGTTPLGGAHGNGIVFKLVRGRPRWKEQILYAFGGGPDGGAPIGGVTIDAKGNLYGTTHSGGDANCNCGVVYELIRGRRGAWTQSILHSFTGIPQGYQCHTIYDGSDPSRSAVALDSAGNLYGTTHDGGEACENGGTVWELAPLGGGNWSYSLLHVASDQIDGENAGVALDSQGNIYGAALEGNLIFELVKAQGYQSQILYQPMDEEGYYDTVTLDSADNVYWTSQAGGGAGYLGTVQELTQGSWTHSTLYAFALNGEAGTEPIAGVMVDPTGSLYGTSSMDGGSQGNGKGTVWEITP